MTGGPASDASAVSAPPPRLPPWLRFRVPRGAAYRATAQALERAGLATVCQEARCPNVHDCWGRKTATVLILGDTCTRACRFCSVRTAAHPPAPDPDEPARVARLARELGWRYVVLTSVDRDDLPDQGAGHYAATVLALRRSLPEAVVEVLAPDFGADPARLDRVLGAGPQVFGHNLETVRRLSPTLRDRRAGYETSLAVLAHAARHPSRPVVKSSLLLGLGETLDEVRQALEDLRRAGVTALTLGQYLRPDRRAVPVRAYLRPEVFDRLAEEARSLGFAHVASGPLVRSSYHAQEFLDDLVRRSSTGAPA